MWRYDCFCVLRLLKAITPTEPTNTKSRIAMAYVESIRTLKRNTASEAITRMIPAAIKSRPVTRLTAYQILSSDRVFFVRQPYQRFGLTLPRTNGIPRPMKTNPTAANSTDAANVVISTKAGCARTLYDVRFHFQKP